MRFKPYYSGPQSDHFDGQQFFLKRPFPNNLKEVLKWRLFGTRPSWPASVAIPEPDIPIERIYEGLKITFIGHATVLIQACGFNILTDPHFSLRASPIAWWGPKRRKPPGLPLAHLPPIDAVFVSHNHFDHLDLPSVREIWSKHQPLIITPLGNDQIIQEKNRAMRIQTMDWNDTISLSPDVSLTLLPSRHWSGRGILDRNQALWGAAYLRFGSASVLFLGDSGFDPELFQSFPQEPTAALLPIGAYAPQWFMHYAHMSPEEAWETFKIMQGQALIPIHHDVFPLGDEPFGEALPRLHAAAGEQAARIISLDPGQSTMITQ